MSGAGGRGPRSEEVEEQKDRLEGQESTDCDTDADIQPDTGGGTGKDNKESAASVPPAKARRDAFI